MAIDLAYAARKIFFTEQGSLDIPKMLTLGSALQKGESSNAEITELLGGPSEHFYNSAIRSSLPLKTHIFNVVEQLHDIDWNKVVPTSEGGLLQSATDLITEFSKVDSLAGDREQGICPIPTYELSESDWELFETTKHIDEVQDRLKALEIYQYFYPPTDRLALGLLDRGSTTGDALQTGLTLTAEHGHELSQNSLIAETSDLREIVEEFKEKGYLVDGDLTLEITETGRLLRQNISVRPSEGLIAKISKIISFKVDISLKDILGPK